MKWQQIDVPALGPCSLQCRWFFRTGRLLLPLLSKGPCFDGTATARGTSKSPRNLGQQILLAAR